MNRTDVVLAAKAWLNTPYHHQAAIKHAGCDCLGLVRGVYKDLYGEYPEEPPAYTQTWGEYDKQELMMEAALRHLELVAMAPEKQVLPNPLSMLQVGQVWLFRAKPGAIAKHCSIITSLDMMIHSYSGYGVRETSISIWSSRVAGIFDFPALSG